MPLNPQTPDTTILQIDASIDDGAKRKRSKKTMTTPVTKKKKPQPSTPDTCVDSPASGVDAGCSVLSPAAAAVLGTASPLDGSPPRPPPPATPDWEAHGCDSHEYLSYAKNAVEVKRRERLTRRRRRWLLAGVALLVVATGVAVGVVLGGGGGGGGEDDGGNGTRGGASGIDEGGDGGGSGDSGGDGGGDDGGSEPGAGGDTVGGAGAGAGDSPTSQPTLTPTTGSPTSYPTDSPTSQPSTVPSSFPTVAPSSLPTITSAPSSVPTVTPTASPTVSPTDIPTSSPTEAPTASPTGSPTTVFRASLYDAALTLSSSVGDGNVDEAVMNDVTSAQRRAVEFLAEEYDAFLLQQQLADSTSGGSATASSRNATAPPQPILTETDVEQTSSKFQQRYALAVLHYALNIDQHDELSTSWLQHQASECSWEGIQCSSSSSNSTKDAVTEVILLNKELTGYLPDEIGLLTSIQKLDLAENQLYGKIPEGLYDLGTTKDYESPLIGLYLNKNKLTGTLSDRLDRLNNIVEFYVGENELEGQFPFVGKKRPNHWRFLSTYKNKFTGTFPEGMRLRNLAYLDMSHNKMTGDLPTDLPDYLKLKWLYLSHNKFDGPIPDNLADIRKIQEIHLNDNKLTGGFPGGWANDNKSLLTIRVQNNRLTKNFPNNVCKLSVLKMFNELVELSADCDVCNCNDLCKNKCY